MNSLERLEDQKIALGKANQCEYLESIRKLSKIREFNANSISEIIRNSMGAKDTEEMDEQRTDEKVCQNIGSINVHGNRMYSTVMKTGNKRNNIKTNFKATTSEKYKNEMGAYMGINRQGTITDPPSPGTKQSKSIYFI